MDIDITAIPREKRYVYTVDYIFPNPYQSASAFVKRNAEAGFHIQEFYEICVISKGKGYHVVEDTVVKAKKGDVFIVPPGRRHAIQGEGLDIHYIHISPKFFEQYLEKMTELPTFFNLFEIEPLMRVRGNTYRHLYIDEPSLKKVTAIIESLETMWQYDPTSKLMVEGYIIVILTIFCREYEKLQTIVGKNANNDKFFMDSISYVIKHYNERLVIDDLAHAAGLSRTVYIKRFRETTGKSPKQFITHTRIAAAKKLLATNHSISKIAEETGFYDAAHFMKTFLAVTGMSPTEYRNADNTSASQYQSIIN